MNTIVYNGDKISKLSLGTVQFGLNYGINNTEGILKQQDIDEIITYVSSKGINCFDTAQAYGNAEEVLGKALFNIDNAFVISKITSDFFKNSSIDSINKSLSNLQIDTLYGLLLHDTELLYEWKENYNFIINNLIANNKIKYFGISIYTSDEFHLALENERISFIQIPFNLFDQRALTENWFDKAKEKNKLIFIRSVFLQGLLLMDINKVPKKLSHAIPYLQKLEDFCIKYNITQNELALNFVNSIAKNSLLLFGCDNLSQAKENIETYNSLVTLDESTILYLKNEFSTINENIYNPTRW